jgi:hypothetical protein
LLTPESKLAPEGKSKIVSQKSEIIYA